GNAGHQPALDTADVPEQQIGKLVTARTASGLFRTVRALGCRRLGHVLSQKFARTRVRCTNSSIVELFVSRRLPWQRLERVAGAATGRSTRTTPWRRLAPASRLRAD